MTPDPQPPNCSTCPHAVDKSTPGNIVYRCKVDGQFLWELQFNYLCEHGCLYHPDARAYLMRDVVEELERLYNEEITDSSSYAEGRGDGYDRAISLIRDGVKK